jgi:hypothetical protein
MKLFHRSKIKEKPQINDTPIQKPIEEQEKKQNMLERTEERNKAPTKEYNETLYSKGFSQKKTTTTPQENQKLRRITWENAETIERNIDNMDITQTESTSSRTQKGIDTEKKVDFILLKKKK